MRLGVFSAALTGALLASGAQAAITQITVSRVEPFADGMQFGESGAYERVVGTAKGELDPADERNKVIADLDKAPRNAAGRVEYETEFYILRPVDPNKGNGKILYEITNRGRKFMLHWLMDAPAQAVSAVNEPAGAKDAGNGLFFRQGFVMVWSGWDPDAPKSNNGMAMKAPVAFEPGGGPIVRRIRDEFVSATRSPTLDSFRMNYEAASLDQSQARLTVRRMEGDPKVEIPADGWAYADNRTIKLLPEGTKPVPGTLYEFHYPARDPKVLGVGFAATRDLASYLRYEEKANPAGGPMNKAIAYGVSQAGRYLRDHIALGFNQDESGRKVFDGVLVQTAGIGRVFMNQLFGQPSRTNTQHEDHTFPENEFPFSAAKLDDLLTGRSGSLFRRDGFDPFLIEVNTSTEYWQKGASLLHTDTLGEEDVELPDDARAYLIAGTQHAGRVGLTPAPGPCANLRNPHNPAPAIRALVVALDQWVSNGIEPPPSRVPGLEDGTLAPPDTLGFPAIPGLQVARMMNAVFPPGDWVDPQPPARFYRPLVPRVDFDGNETSGVRLPDIAVPLGTFTGWNLYKEPFPAGALCDRDGSYAPFPKTKEEQEAKGDPRPSLAERYGDHAGYVSRVAEVSARLVLQRLLLREDAERYVQAAQRTNPLQ